MTKVAILDDYSRVALASADWTHVAAKAQSDVFDEHLNEHAAVAALSPFEILCTMRERMALPRRLIEKLPRLRLITIIGMSLPNLDMDAATEHGIIVAHANFQNPAYANVANATPEFAWGLMLATVRNIARENQSMRNGGWQNTVGVNLAGRTLGILGLGRVGKRMAEYAKAFGMDVIAWSQNLTEEKAVSAGARLVELDALFREADILSIHVQLSERTRGLVTERELALMKPNAYLINTARGPIVDETALIRALSDGGLAGAGLDVFDVEPLPSDHPFQTMKNVTLTPHLGFATEETFRAFYQDSAEAITAYLAGAPIRVVNPTAMRHARHHPDPAST